MSISLEEKIIEKTKAPSLNLVKNLNCWGWKLTNISIITKLPSIRVLNLSVNQITILQPLEECHQLVELYLRKNNIQDLNQLIYLNKLKYLRVLWLSDNPCVNVDNYRERVCELLPQLEKLDNQRIPKPSDDDDDDDDDDEGKVKTNLVIKREKLSANIQIMTKRDRSRRTDHLSTNNSTISSQKSHNSIGSNNNVLSAVVCLLKELTAEELEIVIQKAHEQINDRQSIETPTSDVMDIVEIE